MSDVLRKPNDQEQAVIAAVYEAITRVESKRLTV